MINSQKRESGRGWGRGIFRGNGRGREMHQTTSENDERDRQDENWSMPANMEERVNIRQESQGIPPASPHLKEDLLIGVV